MKLLSVFFVVFLVVEISGSLEHRCGANLVQMLWIVCAKGFNEMLNKRSDYSDSVLPEIDNDLSYPYISGPLSEIFQGESRNYLAKTRRTRMLGIVEECCKKACTINELSAYCV